MQLELSLSFCLQWGKYFMFVLGKHQILILARNTFQNKPPGIQPLLGMEHSFCLLLLIAKIEML